MAKAKKMKIYRWRTDEIKLVKKLYPVKGPWELAERLGRSVATVKQRAYSMGLKMNGDCPRSQWPPDKLRLLKKEYPRADSKKLARRIGRPLTAVRQKAYEMGLTKKTYRLWLVEELKLLRKLHKRMEIKDIAKKLNRSVNAIKRKIKSEDLR